MIVTIFSFYGSKSFHDVHPPVFHVLHLKNMDASLLAHFEHSVSCSYADWALWMPFLSLPLSLSLSPLKLCHLLREALQSLRFPVWSAGPVRLFLCCRTWVGVRVASALTLCVRHQHGLCCGEQTRERENEYIVFLKGSRSRWSRKIGGTFLCVKLYITKFAILTIFKWTNPMTIMTFTALCSRQHHLLRR